jgi:hypothetical protein
MKILLLRTNTYRNLNTFEQIYDVRNCACHLVWNIKLNFLIGRLICKYIFEKILSAILPHLIRHWNAAGRIDRTYFFMIEHAACLLAHNKSFSVSFKKKKKKKKFLNFLQ